MGSTLLWVVLGFVLSFLMGLYRPYVPKKYQKIIQSYKRDKMDHLITRVIIHKRFSVGMMWLITFAAAFMTVWAYAVNNASDVVNYFGRDNWYSILLAALIAVIGIGVALLVYLIGFFIGEALMCAILRRKYREYRVEIQEF